MKYNMILIALVLFVLASTSFAGEVTGGLHANLTGCTAGAAQMTTIDEQAVIGNGTSNFTLGANMSTTGPTVFNRTTGGSCITITTNNITLDLNGSTITLANAAASTPLVIGINISNYSRNITIINGIINVSNVPGNTEVTANYEAIRIASSANVTLRNITINYLSPDGTAVNSGIAVNISNVTVTNTGFILLNNVNISNVTTAGVSVENSTGVNITGSFFGMGGGTWLISVPVIRSVDGAATKVLNVTGVMINNTNLSLFAYSNISVFMQTVGPITAGPGGAAIGTSKSYLTTKKMVNLTGLGGGASANLTLLFSSADISPFSITDLTAYSTGDSLAWTGPLTATNELIYSSSITITNLATAGVYTLFGYTAPTQSSGTTQTSSASSGSDVPTPSITYSCTDDTISLHTRSEFSGGSARVEYYRGATLETESASIDSSGVAVFDYRGAGEYNFIITSVGSSTGYKTTKVGYDLTVSNYNPTVDCPSTQTAPAPVVEEPAEEEVAQPTEVVEEETPAPVTKPAPQPSASDAERESALKAIADADKEIQTAQKQNKDISAAKKKLDEASAALKAKNYAGAASLANAAMGLAKTAPVSAAKPDVVAEQPAPQGGFDGGLLIGVVVVVLLVGAVYFWMSSKGKKK